VPLFAPVFDALNRSGTRYVVVGGVATILHGFVRGTTDVDVVIDLDEPSARRAIQELEAIGYRPQVPVQATDFANRPTREMWARDRGMIVFSLYSDVNPVVVDLFVRSPMNFEELWTRSEVRSLEGGEVRVASLDDLIRIKRDAARPQDLVDVTELEAIKRDATPGKPPK
jgi:predicted nucleotidyltransferase